MADFNEPVDNPWARPAPAPPAVDDDDGDHEHASHGARDGGHHEAARPSGSAPSSAIGGTAPTRMESQRRLAADPVAAVPKSDAPRKAGRGRCLQRCCRGFHRVLVESSTGGVSLLLILALASLGLFSYSAWLLDGRATVGSGCDDQTCVRGYSAGDTCAGFATLKAGMKCENVCTSRELAGVVPFRFTMYPPPTGVSNADRWLSCPFPRTNSNWRIPVTFFTGLLNLGGVIGYCLRWRRAMGLMAFLTLASAGFHFYLMIIDSDAVNKAALACASNFAGVTTAYGPASPTGIYGGGVTCDMVRIIAGVEWRFTGPGRAQFHSCESELL